jgi:hypothetical protein
MYLLKSKTVDSDIFDGELILMNLETRQVLVLNETASILWTAVGLLTTREELLDLLQEAMPQIHSSQVETSLDEVLDALLRGGFLQTSSEIAVCEAQPSS